MHTASEALKAVNRERSLLEARLLLGHVLHCSVESLLIKDQQELSLKEERNFQKLLERRLQFEPMAYILGRKEFYGLNFFVDSRVLIPRPETEGLVEHVLRWVERSGIQSGRIIDLGTGSGCIALALAKNLGDGFNVIGLDCSESALEVARQNQASLSLQVDWALGDMCKPSAEILERGFDIIVSNPPYIPTRIMPSLQKDIHFEPSSALDGGDSGVQIIESILKHWMPALRKPGLLALECMDDDQVQSLAQGFDSSIDLICDSPYLLCKR